MKYDINNKDHNDPNKFKINDGTVFDHVIECLKTSDSSDPIVNLSILLHDVGKPRTYEQKEFEDGSVRHTYTGHAKKGYYMIDKIAARLKMSNEEKDACKFVAENHMKFHDIDIMRRSKVRQLIDNKNFDVLVKASKADAKSRVGLFDAELWNGKMEYINDIKNQMSPKEVMKVVDSKEVMKAMGLKKGNKDLGEVIKRITDRVINNKVTISYEINAIVVDEVVQWRKRNAQA
jgi:tRNA nucleotidyltransferase (CCA-adding enzyme)